MFCKYCGKEVSEDATVCEYCGKSFEHSIEQKTTNVTKKQIRTPRIRRNIVLMIIVLMIVAALFGIILLSKLIYDDGSTQSKDASKRIIDGSYYGTVDNEEISLDIDDGKAIIVYDESVYEGNVDYETEIIEWDDEAEEEPSEYTVINDKLLVSMSLGKISFKKGNMSKAPKASDEYNYKYNGNTDSLYLGEYYVGTDIKPGSYIISFNYSESNTIRDNGKGTITTFVKGVQKGRVQFNNDEERRLVLEKGMKLKLTSKGSDSWFTLKAD